MALDFTTTARVKAYATDFTTSDHDALIATLISGVSRLFEKYMGREALTTSRTEYFDVDSQEQSRFYLKAYPVASVTSVKNEPDHEFATATSLDSDDYDFSASDDAGQLTIRGVRMLTGPRALQIVYSGGMSTDTSTFVTDFPDLAMAADMQTFYVFQRRDEMGLASTSIGGSSSSYEPFGLLKHVRSILDEYRNPAYM